MVSPLGKNHDVKCRREHPYTYDGRSAASIGSTARRWSSGGKEHAKVMSPEVHRVRTSRSVYRNIIPLVEYPRRARENGTRPTTEIKSAGVSVCSNSTKLRRGHHRTGHPVDGWTLATRADDLRTDLDSGLSDKSWKSAFSGTYYLRDPRHP